MAEKLRIHQLAKELNVSSKDILGKCAAEDVEVKNHMSTVSAGLGATIREWFSEGVTVTATEIAERVDLKQVRKKKVTPRRRKKKEVAAKAAITEERVGAAVALAPSAKLEPTEESPVMVEPPALQEVELPPPEKPEEPIQEKEPVIAAEAPTPVEPPEKVEPPPPEPIEPVGPQNVPEPAQLKGPRIIRYESPEPITIGRTRPGPGVPRLRQTRLEDVAPSSAEPSKAAPSQHRGRSKTYQRVETGVIQRGGGGSSVRREARGSEASEKLREWGDRDLAERQERVKGATGRRVKRRATEGRTVVEHRVITQTQVTEPIILKDFCAATGLSLLQLTPKLINDLKILPNINMILEKDGAELLASEFGIELTVVAAKSPLDDLRKEFQERPRPELRSRAPVVTLLGHVDHGKTSLLDAIRHTRVAAGEAGGITQHMGSYHLTQDGLSVTFLDTPGHQAFTAMRARGAQLTDVVVLVVAADDGVMPQTVEAINHARAADVPIVVALNKIDLPGMDLNKVYGQLADHDLAPTEWGGTVDVIKTSATQGIGIDELVEHLSTLSDLLELKADPTIPACGRVIEAQMKPGVGVVARVLIQDGSLKKGDVIVCGPGFGKVRSMNNDQEQELVEAGPSMPVEISGLDELPDAGDEFYQVDSLKRAEQAAEEVKQQRRRSSLSAFNKPRTLEDLFDQKKAGEIPELNVIVRADVQGSVDVLRKSLSEFPSDQVKLNILHSGVGGIAESDVLLAEASGAIVIGFQVVADSHVKRLAEENSVDIRQYRVIYNVMDDIKKALEGLLEPEEQLEQRGQAEVREIFKVSKLGTVAGCYIREGTVARNHKTRIIRDGVVVRDNASIHSLRRFKDDVKEVKVGYECGIKIEGFDDVKPDDIIETYEVIKIARKL